MIFVRSYGCVVGPDGTGGRVVPELAGEGPTALPPFSLYKPVFNITHYTSVRTHKNQNFLLSQAFKWKIIMFFVIPEMSCLAVTSWLFPVCPGSSAPPEILFNIF